MSEPREWSSDRPRGAEMASGMASAGRGEPIAAAVALVLVGQALAGAMGWAPRSWLALAAIAGTVVVAVALRERVARRGGGDVPAARLLALAPRVAAVTVVAQAVLAAWVGAATGLSTELRGAITVAVVVLGAVLLASLMTIALRIGPRWAVAGVGAWAVAWVAMSAERSAAVLWSLGGSLSIGAQLRPLDGELVQVLATAGAVAIGAALVGGIRELRARHSALVLLVGHAVFGVLAALAERRIERATGLAGITVLRRDRELASQLAAVALAGLLWQYWRRVVVPELRR